MNPAYHNQLICRGDCPFADSRFIKKLVPTAQEALEKLKKEHPEQPLQNVRVAVVNAKVGPSQFLALSDPKLFYGAAVVFEIVACCSFKGFAILASQVFSQKAVRSSSISLTPEAVFALHLSLIAGRTSVFSMVFQHCRVSIPRCLLQIMLRKAVQRQCPSLVDLLLESGASPIEDFASFPNFLMDNRPLTVSLKCCKDFRSPANYFILESLLRHAPIPKEATFPALIFFPAIAVSQPNTGKLLIETLGPIFNIPSRNPSPLMASFDFLAQFIDISHQLMALKILARAVAPLLCAGARLRPWEILSPPLLSKIEAFASNSSFFANHGQFLFQVIVETGAGHFPWNCEDVPIWRDALPMFFSYSVNRTLANRCREIILTRLPFGFNDRPQAVSNLGLTRDSSLYLASPELEMFANECSWAVASLTFNSNYS